MTKQLLTFTSVLALTLGVLAAAHAIDERHSYAGSGWVVFVKLCKSGQG